MGRVIAYIPKTFYLLRHQGLKCHYVDTMDSIYDDETLIIYRHFHIKRGWKYEINPKHVLLSDLNYQIEQKEKEKR